MLEKINQKGVVSIFLVVVILAVILVIALGFANISSQQISISKQLEVSAKAYQAADSGLEYALKQYKDYVDNLPVPPALPLPSAYFPTNICNSSGNCPLGVGCPSVGEGQYCLRLEDNSGGAVTSWDAVSLVKSFGKAGNTRRAVGVKITP